MAQSQFAVDRRSVLKATGSLSVASLAGCTLLGSGGSDTITIVGTLPLSGSNSSLGQDTERGYEIGVEMMNENGGIDGKSVEFQLEDDESNPEQVGGSLQETVNDDVQMIFGSITSLLVPPAAAVGGREEIPVLGTAFAFEEPHEEDGWLFAPFPKTRDHTKAAEELIQLPPEGERVERIAIWEPNSGWGEEQSDDWEQRLTNAGYDVVFRDTFQIGSQDFSSLISRSRDADAEMLMSCPITPDAITAVNQLEESNYSPKAIHFIRATDTLDWWGAVGSTGEYVTTSPGWAPSFQGNGNEELVQRYNENYDVPADSPPPIFTGMGFGLAQTAAQALEASSSMDPEDVRSALYETSFATVMGEFDFDTRGMPKEGQLTALTQWYDGEEKLIWPESKGEAIEYQYPMTPWGDR